MTKRLETVDKIATDLEISPFKVKELVEQIEGKWAGMIPDPDTFYNHYNDVQASIMDLIEVPLVVADKLYDMGHHPEEDGGKPTDVIYGVLCSYLETVLNEEFEDFLEKVG